MVNYLACDPIKEKLVPIYVTESQQWVIKNRMSALRISKYSEYIQSLLDKEVMR